VVKKHAFGHGGGGKGGGPPHKKLLFPLSGGGSDVAYNIFFPSFFCAAKIKIQR
jgi:hypothetical protein